MSTLSTHVLDISTGRPAPGIRVQLTARDGRQWDEAVTDADGRIADLGQDPLEPGAYTLQFDTGSYMNGFYPEVAVTFTVADTDEHYHVPLLLSPYGYSTYRGT